MLFLPIALAVLQYADAAPAPPHHHNEFDAAQILNGTIATLGGLEAFQSIQNFAYHAPKYISGHILVEILSLTEPAASIAVTLSARTMACCSLISRSLRPDHRS